MARITKPPMFCDRIIEACRYEYKTRNLIDGRIVQCDQRISIVAGYLTEEVSGLSPFTFIHRDDVRWVMVALRQSKNHGIQSFIILLINSILLKCMTLDALSENHVIV